MSIIRLPSAADPIDVDAENLVEVELHVHDMFSLDASRWPPGHALCNHYCSGVEYHFHHDLSHPHGRPGAYPYWVYLIEVDSDRLLATEPPSIYRDLSRLPSLDRNQLLALRRSYRNYRHRRGPSTIPQRDPSIHRGWDDPLKEDLENTPPLQDWNFDYQSGLYFP